MRFTTAYEYYSDSKEYWRATKIQQNPLNPGEWLFPPCTVLDQPLTPMTKKAIIWNQNQSKWEYVDDHRGEFLYNKDDSRVKIQIKSLYYDIPENYTDIIPPDETNWYKFNNNSWKIYHEPATRDELFEFVYNEKCKVAYGYINVTKGGQVYQFLIDKDSMATISNQIVAFTVLGQTSTIWKVYQNGEPTTLELTKQEFTQIYQNGKSVVEAAFALEGTYNEQIKGLTETQLANYDYITSFKQNIQSEFAKINIDFMF